MRVLLGLALLVIVLATVAQLVKSQLGSLSVLGGLPTSSSAPAASAAAPVGPGLRTTPITDDVKRILDAGAASRASEPER
ncbi:MAG: hypothetical protein JNN18_11235 [Rubrivivax sp.]|nr:hypothetical protein [Rubrivivax sp.]